MLRFNDSTASFFDRLVTLARGGSSSDLLKQIAAIVKTQPNQRNVRRLQALAAQITDDATRVPLLAHIAALLSLGFRKEFRKGFSRTHGVSSAARETFSLIGQSINVGVEEAGAAAVVALAVSEPAAEPQPV